MKKEEKMTCRKNRKQIIPWLDGELRPDRAAELLARFEACDKVRHCTECRKLTEEYRSFHRVFQSHPQSEFPAFLHQRIMDSVNNRREYYSRKAVRARWQLVPASLAIAMSLFFGSLVGINMFSPQNEVKTTARTTERYNFGDNGMVSTMNPNGTYR